MPGPDSYACRCSPTAARSQATDTSANPRISAISDSAKPPMIVKPSTCVPAWPAAGQPGEAVRHAGKEGRQRRGNRGGAQRPNDREGAFGRPEGEADGHRHRDQADEQEEEEHRAGHVGPPWSTVRTRGGRIRDVRLAGRVTLVALARCHDRGARNRAAPGGPPQGRRRRRVRRGLRGLSPAPLQLPRPPRRAAATWPRTCWRRRGCAWSPARRGSPTTPAWPPGCSPSPATSTPAGAGTTRSTTRAWPTASWPGRAAGRGDALRGGGAQRNRAAAGARAGAPAAAGSRGAAARRRGTAFSVGRGRRARPLTGGAAQAAATGPRAAGPRDECTRRPRAGQSGVGHHDVREPVPRNSTRHSRGSARTTRARHPPSVSANAATWPSPHASVSRATRRRSRGGSSRLPRSAFAASTWRAPCRCRWPSCAPSGSGSPGTGLRDGGGKGRAARLSS